ncbi:hypothetical protein [Saccharothrix longispora]|uniref:hypothetical protein n=1 Tax=Saccharothrix longispora TaxID=33920 RepID=UPI0028FDB735|nr:hypothetical protein [Saccharothrix longispora]MDU0288990.1 hypothetical protein [Saccharothrix longispora]
MLGALFGWLSGLFDWVDPLIAGLLPALYGAICGAVLGGLCESIGHAMTGGRRDFSSVAGNARGQLRRAGRREVADRAGSCWWRPGAPGHGRLSGI